MDVPVVLASESVAFGGVEVALLQLAEHLDRQRFNISVFAPCSDAVQPLVHRLAELNVPLHTASRSYGKYDPTFVVALLRHVRQRRARLVHLQLSHIYGFEHVIPLLKGSGVPVILTTDQNGPFAPPKMEWARRVLKRFNCGLLDGMFVVSKELERLLIEQFRAPPHKVWRLPNSTSPRRFHPTVNGQDVRQALGVRPRAPLIVSVARLEPQKGISFLITAIERVLQQHPTVQLWIVGAGGLRAQLEDQVRRCGVVAAVHFLGFRDDLPALIAAADIFVLPSLYEGLPLSILEAMATERPVIATRVGGTPDVVDDGVTGLLVPPADSDALATAILRLLDAPQLGRRLATAAAELVRREYSVTAVVGQISERYTARLAARGIRA